MTGAARTSTDTPPTSSSPSSLADETFDHASGALAAASAPRRHFENTGSAHFERRYELLGNAEGKAGSFWHWVAGEVTVVLVSDAAGDGEAETVTGFGGVESDEAFENAFALKFRHAGAVINDARLNVSVLFF